MVKTLERGFELWYGVSNKREIMEKLGTYLKKEREARNCSLEEISLATKIRKGILSAIENDDYTLLPPPVFVKGFLKAYAAHLGLNYSEIIKMYKTVDARYAEEEEEEIMKGKRGRKYFKPRAVPLAAGLIVLIFISYFIFVKPSSTPEENKVVSPPAGSPLIETTGAEGGGERPTLADKGSPGQELLAGSSHGEGGVAVADGSEVKRLNLEFKTREETWIGFRLDNEKPSQVLLQTGESFILRADRIIRLKIGNAGGVDLFFNERKLLSQGISGEVVRLTLTEEGLSRPIHDEQLYY